MTPDDLSMTTAFIFATVAGTAAGMLAGLVAGTLWALRIGRDIARTIDQVSKEARGEWEV